MGARVIDLSKLSEKQMMELSRHIRKRKHGNHIPAFRTEPVDDNVFAPLAEAIARDGCKIGDIEENFRATKFRQFESIRGDEFKSHYSYYLGFLFETAVQMSILKFAQENPEMISVLRDTSGTLAGGRRYCVDSRGSAVFYRTADQGRTMQTLAEIDLVGEIRESGTAIPVIFEITLMNGHRKDFKNRRKAELLEEIYGRKPYFCVVRPAYNNEEPGTAIQFSPERGVWRDILLPRNDSIRALASRLMAEEQAASVGAVEETAMGA